MAWQAATLVLVAGAAGMFVLPIAAAWRPSEANWDATGGKPVQVADAGSAGMSLAEAQSIGDILAGLLPKAAEPEPPKVEEKPIVEVPDDEPRTPATANGTRPIPAATTANWVYLGSAVTPRASRALVRIDQTQKFIRQGSELDGVKLLEVYDDHIVIEENSLQRRIDRAQSVAGSMLAPPRTGAAARPGAVQPPAQTPPAGSAAAALAAAELAHGKAKSGGPNAPGRLVARVMQLSPEQRQQAFVTMTNPLATDEEKIKVISELGFDPEATLDERREAIRALGLNPDDPDVLRVIEEEMNGAARGER